MRFRRPRPRSLYRWLLLALALMLAPQFVGAAIEISTQQREISESRGAGREIAARLASIARLEATLDAAEDAVLRDPRAAASRVRATLARAHDDAHALGAPVLERQFTRLETLAAGDLNRPGAIRRLEAPLDSLRTQTAELSDETIADLRAQEATGRSDQRAHVLGILVAFAATLLITLLIARAFIASIRRPLRELRSGARRVGSGDLAHRVELDSFTEFNQVADSFNTMADALRRSGRELRDRAFHDALTGLANRALLFNRIAHALARRGRDGERDPVGVLYVNLDDFKSFNDSLGHSRGDQVLVEVARRLRGVLRPSDTVARLGGDEFAVLVEDLTEDADATRVAERILFALGAPVTVAGRELELHASIGVAVSGAQLHDADELVRAADLAMHAAKSGGKGRYRAFEPSMLSGTVDRLALEHDLKFAIARDELELHYQPVVDLATGRARGVEALARWTHPERGPVYPDVFIPLAEQSGVIVPLGRRLLERACAELPALREGLGEPDLIISVNLAAAELLAPGLTDHIRASLRSAGITPGSLILEITETQLMSDPDAAAARLHELKALGVHLALDDFGTGYSSLAYLRSFPVDALKIDKAFIDNVADPDSDNHALVRAIISLGKSLDLRVVAEGIEDIAQCRELERLRCDRGQGYLFSRPLPRLELVDTFGRQPASRYS